MFPKSRKGFSFLLDVPGGRTTDSVHFLAYLLDSAVSLFKILLFEEDKSRICEKSGGVKSKNCLTSVSMIIECCMRNVAHTLCLAQFGPS